MNPSEQSITPFTLHARSLDDLLDVIPSLLGFHPEESLVMVLIESKRVRVTARLDLDVTDSVDGARAALAPLWCEFPGADVFAVAYADDPDRAWAALAVACRLVPCGRRCTVSYVDGERSYASRADPGVPYDPSRSALAAEATYRGLRVLPGRSSLQALVEPAHDQGQVTRAEDALRLEQPEETFARAFTLVEARMATPGPVTALEAASLGLAASCPEFADWVVAGIAIVDADRAVALWSSVVRATTVETGASASVILGMAAWIRGDGALLNICLERAEAMGADSRWFRFADVARRVCLPPSAWEEVRAELAQVCRAA